MIDSDLGTFDWVETTENDREFLICASHSSKIHHQTKLPPLVDNGSSIRFERRGAQTIPSYSSTCQYQMLHPNGRTIAPSGVLTHQRCCIHLSHGWITSVLTCFFSFFDYLPPFKPGETEEQTTANSKSRIKYTATHRALTLSRKQTVLTTQILYVHAEDLVDSMVLTGQVNSTTL